ncbi:hypothetical protein ABZX98_25930 [Streptomyces sp. NPDC002992]|uniref:hypothetical protein n=1 Tax=Streptomyces sp. NPDC002992 TaxID=3154273 RepID=UPI0033B21D4C
MHAAELDRRARSYDGWIPPHLVSWLVEHGYLHEVEAQARGGDRFCAQERVRILVEQDRRDEALEALAPYLATGWWKAARSVAELLDTWGRVDEAIAVFRSNMAADWRLALKHFALLLARHGRATSCGSTRPPRPSGPLPVGLGRDEEVAALLAARVPAGRQGGARPSGAARDSEPDNAIDLLATAREREGRVDEAIALLRPRQITCVNGRDQLADLLARHDSSSRSSLPTPGVRRRPSRYWIRPYRPTAAHPRPRARSPARRGDRAPLPSSTNRSSALCSPVSRVQSAVRCPPWP